MFAGKKSAQIREILISESAWEEMTCLFAPSLEILNKDNEWLEHEVTKKGFNKISEVYLGEYLSGRINLYGYEK